VRVKREQVCYIIRSSLCIWYWLFCFVDNPVQLPVCDKKSWHPSTNGQFQYEVESTLTNVLDEQYGMVLIIRRTSCNSDTLILLQGMQTTNSLIAYYELVVQKYSCETSYALHIGCGVGYTTMMLAKTFESVSRIDLIK